MPPLSTLVSRYLAQYQFLATALLVVAVFVAAGVLSYWWIYLPQARRQAGEDPSVAIAKRAPLDHVIVYYFHVDWCPHCVTARPEWDGFARTMDGKTVNGQVVRCVDVNLTDEKSETGVDGALRQKYEVKSFPTVQLQRKDGSVVVLDARPTEKVLNEFVRESI